MIWIDSDRSFNSVSADDKIWGGYSSSTEPWYEEIKKYKTFPEKRLELAYKNLPFPAAFEEAMIALRAIIKQKIKTNTSIQPELNRLYWFAAVESFSVPYSETVGEPGFNVLLSIPGLVIKELQISYPRLGYKELSCSKTDIKWFTESWGEPENHTTLNKLFRHIWEKYEREYLEEKKEREERFWNELIK